MGGGGGKGGGGGQYSEEEVQKYLSDWKKDRAELGLPTVQVPGTKGVFNDPNPATGPAGQRLSWLNQTVAQGEGGRTRAQMGVARAPGRDARGNFQQGTPQSIQNTSPQSFQPLKRANTYTDKSTPFGKAYDENTGKLVDEEMFSSQPEYEYSPFAQL
jgi:hypothetical protein